MRQESRTHIENRTIVVRRYAKLPPAPVRERILHDSRCCRNTEKQTLEAVTTDQKPRATRHLEEMAGRKHPEGVGKWLRP
jgi:hypothetical protein